MLEVQFGSRCFSVTSEDKHFLDALKRSFLITRVCQKVDFLFNVSFLPESRGKIEKKDLKPFWYGKTSGHSRWGQRRVDILFKDKEVILRPFNFLPVFLSVFYLLERKKSRPDKYRNVFLHAAGIIKNGKGYVFTGPSESGKSTICEFSMPQSTVINDELILASKRYGEFWLSNSPVKGKIYKSTSYKEKISAVFVLKKDHEDTVTRIRGAEAVEKLLPCIVFDECFRFLNEFEYMAERFKLACAIANQIPIYELQFKKGNGLWNCIHSEL